MPRLNGRYLKVGDWLLDNTTGVLQHEDTVEQLDQALVDLLNFLARSPNEVLTGDVILESVWPDAEVGDDVLDVAIAQLLRHFKDDEKDPKYIKVLPQVGYTLVAQVQFIDETIDQNQQTAQRLFFVSISLLLFGVLFSVV